MLTPTLSPRERVAAALLLQESQMAAACAPRPACGCQSLPLAERPTGAATILPCGQRSIKPFEKLAGPVQELVLNGATLGTTPLTPQPRTRAELKREQTSLLREARIIDRRLGQISDELLRLPPAA